VKKYFSLCDDEIPLFLNLFCLGVFFISSKDIMDNEKTPKNAMDYSCVLCDFKCCKQSDWVRHVSRPKHVNNQKRYDMIQINGYKTPENADECYCECGKKYKHKSGLWRHSKHCTGINSVDTLDLIEPKNNDLITYLMNENKELKNMILEVCKTNSNTINNNINNTNSHNKTFNMNVFLNEHCKDAMNISEFVDSIKPGFDDLINVGKRGYVEGISSIIINKLRSLDIHMRPVHCGDEKRNSMYIKEDGKWEKQPEDNKQVRKLIRQVAFKNTGNTILFKEKYPDCVTSASKYSDQYNKIVMESYGGRGASTDEEKENKIVRMIAKEVYIDKTM